MSQAILKTALGASAALLFLSSCASAAMQVRAPIVYAAPAVRPALPAPLVITPPAPEPDAAAAIAPPVYLAEREPVIDLDDKAVLTDAELLAMLSGDLNQCRRALDAAGVSYVDEGPKRTREGCGYSDAITVSHAEADYSQDLVMTCAMAARMQLWERHVVQPAARKHLGADVEQVKAFGAFSCRRVAGTSRLSNHAFGEAVDISGFRAANGRVASVLGDFRAHSAEGRFLREVFRESCEVFDTALGPNYNAAHANHFHFDIGGGRAFCH